MNWKNFHIQNLDKLCVEQKAELCELFKQHRGKNYPGPVLTLADLLDALPFYRQVLLIGKPDTPAEDFLREIAFGLAEKKRSVTYFLSYAPVQELLAHYYTCKTGICANDLKTGNFSTKNLKEINQLLDRLHEAHFCIARPIPGASLELPLPQGEDINDNKDMSKIWVLDSPSLFLHANSPEDPKTRLLSLLAELKEEAKARDLTHIMLLSNTYSYVQDCIRAEALEVPDLILVLSPQTQKADNNLYLLSSYKNDLNDVFELGLSYDKSRRQFKDK